MKKITPVLLGIILLTACSNHNAESLSERENNTEKTGSIISSGAVPQSDFTENELEPIRRNFGKSSDNNSVNLKCEIPARVCFVPETDTLFYSDNSGLFLKSGGAVIRLSDDNAMSLNLYDGKLYYMIPKGGTKFECGNVYCLDLSTMQKELIIGADVHSLSVHSGRIFYQTAEMKTLDNGSYMLGLTSMECGLNGENAEKCFGKEFVYQNGTSVFFSGGVVRTLDEASGTEMLLYEEPKNAGNLCIFGNSVYYICYDFDNINSNSVKRLDLSGGEPEEFSLKQRGGDPVYFLDYGFADGALCLYDGISFYIAEPDGKFTEYENKNAYRAVYTCGNDVYALKTDGKIARIIFDSNDRESGKFTAAEEILS
ncbi:MAG: hypothetical protein ACI4XA_07325 [Oscillospiraceae bacterium]